MYLGNPLLPINLTPTSAAESIKKELGKKSWGSFELKPLKLNLIPYFLFNYHYYLEHDDTGKKTIKKASHGVLVIDGHNILVRDDLTELLKDNWKRGNPKIPKGEFYEKWCNIEKREQDSVLALKTAEYFGVPRENVVVSAARKMYVPFYKTSVVLNGEEYKLIVNAVNGVIERIENIPQREKGYLELTKETITELKDPANWIKYSKEALIEGGESVSKRAHSINFTKDDKKKTPLGPIDEKIILIIVMIIAIILIIFSVLNS